MNTFSNKASQCDIKPQKKKNSFYVCFYSFESHSPLSLAQGTVTAVQLQTEPQVGQTAAQQVLQVVVGSPSTSAVSKSPCMPSQLALHRDKPIILHYNNDKCNVKISDICDIFALFASVSVYVITHYNLQELLVSKECSHA